MTRKVVIGGGIVLLAAALLPRPAGAVQIRIAHPAPDGSVWDQPLERMAAEWKQITGGAVTVRLFPGGIAGDDLAVVRKMRTGEIHGAALTPTGLAEIDAAFDALSIPLFFDSYEELFFVLDRLEPLFEERLEAKGFVLLHWGLGGWVHMFSKTPIRSVADLKEVKFYLAAGDAEAVEWWKRRGFRPVPLTLADLMTSLQTGLIDAYPSPPLGALTFQWYRLTPYMHELGLGPLTAATVVTERAWNKVPQEHRAALLAAAEKVEDELRRKVPEQERVAIAEMKARGGLTVTSGGDEAAWRAEAEGFARAWRGTRVPAEVFDRLVAARAEFRRRGAAEGSR